MLRKSFVCALLGACSFAFTGAALANGNRVSATQKGSLLMFSKIEIKWDGQGNLIQDTFLDISNDYPGDVAVQAYFINGDIELEEICSGDPCTTIVQAYEPGWNSADCRFELTGNQPAFWSAANGSNKCQPFTVLDPDGPGRPDPETLGATRILRGYVIMWATDFFEGTLHAVASHPGEWIPIRWNHLKGDAVIVNYENGTAWEYNAWAFRSNVPCLPGVGCQAGTVEEGFIEISLGGGGSYDSPPASLLLDFYASGSVALSGGGVNVAVDTDLTIHLVDTDLRQDGRGPPLTKIEAEIWNEFESKFSGTRRCICCWDQTMLSDWVRSVAIPNHFTRSRLGTDKGKARLDGVASDECNYLDLCGPTAYQKRRIQDGCAGQEVASGQENCRLAEESEPAAILGLATKFLVFSSGAQATAGMNLVGAGYEEANIFFDIMQGPEELQGGRTSDVRGDAKGISTGRTSTTRGTVETPAE